MAATDAARTLASLYRAMVASDVARLRELLLPDAFVMSPAADGVHTRADDAAADVVRWAGLAGPDGGIEIRLDNSTSGLNPAGNAAWVFDDLTVARQVDGAERCVTEVRVTAALSHIEDEWRVAAAYWSIPFATQAEQDEVKHAGALTPGVELAESITPDAGPLVALLTDALADPHTLPGLYADVDTHVTIGSVTSEVFLGGAGRAAWSEFVQYVTAFEIRGPMRAATIGPDVAWSAANIDIGSPPTPYRFFYVWLATSEGWRIVVSHDAVSRDPDAVLAS